MKFAIYVVMVEDTEENDMIVGTSGESTDRLAGGLDYDVALELMESARSLVGPFDRGYTDGGA